MQGTIGDTVNRLDDHTATFHFDMIVALGMCQCTSHVHGGYPLLVSINMTKGNVQMVVMKRNVLTVRSDFASDPFVFLHVWSHPTIGVSKPSP